MSNNLRKFRLECLVEDLPNDRDLEVSLFGSEGARESGVRSPGQSDFTDCKGESHGTLGRKSGKSTYLVNPDDLSQDERLKALKGAFNWGRVVAIHTVGEYQIVESVDRKARNDRDVKSETSFHGYRNWKNESVSFYSMDEALVGLIAIKYEGSNSKAGSYFFRMLDRENQA